MKADSLLIVDDQPEILNALERLLKAEYKIFRTQGGQEALEFLKDHPVQVIISDQRMPGMSGVEFLAHSIEIQPHAVRIMITAYADINASISAVNDGQIFYYISKPWENDELLLIVKRAVEQFHIQEENRVLNKKLLKANEQLKHENIILKQNIEYQYDFSNIIGHSPKMLEVFKLVSKVIDTPTTVMILGETGTGKEMLAHAIHYNSGRKDKMFVAQNCGAFPDSLLESELFGHVKGAFTGASSNKKGLFEIADSGTIFLDEIADTSQAMQLRLLRVLQEGEIRPVGANRSTKVDVRVIAATNKILEDEVKKGNFRKDLYYRLNVFPITLPPLRERREDIPDLINHFIDKYSKIIKKSVKGIDKKSLNLLSNAQYPGNIRELENEIERAVTMVNDNAEITKKELSIRFHNPPQEVHANEGTRGNLKDQVEFLEKRLIRQALQTTHGNILKAAELLGLSRPGLHKKLKRYKIDPTQM
ncbi:sigma-54-dependent transcriptional regulator [Calditrichota bacterium]